MYDLDRATRIDGWMNTDELRWLYDTALGMESVVEIGAWCGRSTVALCQGCKGRVFSIDHFRGSAEHQTTMQNGKKPLEEFRKNTSDLENLVLLIGDSATLAGCVEMRYDMLFVDGSHDYTSVIEDLKGWGPRARKLIAGHDYGQGGVGEAVKEYFGDTRIEHGPGTIWSVRRDG